MNQNLLHSGISNGCAQKRGSTGYQFLVLVLALIYAGTLANLPLDVFSDRVNYRNYAENAWSLFEKHWAVSPSAALFNEPLWLLINAGLATLFPTEVVLRLFIFVPAFLVAWTILRQSSHQFVWLLLFLFLPQVIKYHIIQLRQGVAIAVFLTGWFMVRRPLRWLMFIMAPLIHSSFFFVLVLLIVNNVAHRLRFAADMRALLFVCLGVVIGYGLSLIVVFLGARQANTYEFVTTSVTGLGAVFWLMILVLMWLQGHVFMRRHSFEMGVIIFYLTTYFLIEVTARIFEAVILLVLLAGLQLTGWRRISFLVSISSFIILQYIFRLNEPWLGFGVHK